MTSALVVAVSIVTTSADVDSSLVDMTSAVITASVKTFSVDIAVCCVVLTSTELVYVSVETSTVDVGIR